jgi:hypothetical protein
LLNRILSLVTIVLFALLSARLIAQDRRFVIVVALAAAAFLVPSWLARRRMRHLLLSGDVREILAMWQRSFGAGTEPETMTPLVSATTYAAYGFIDEARTALSRAAKGPAWEAAIEQRLFVEALLDVYEGERARAIRKAAELERLPMPELGFWSAWGARRKVALLRRSVAALARAFAHMSRAEDERLLRDAARSSPLVHWAMRYGRAVFLVDAGRKDEARQLLSDAPEWPEASAFRAFHAELAAELA